jgi:chemotaxis-related protein WspD
MRETLADPQASTSPAIDDCWNRIGVRGDASCPELKRHVHCRNCPVHSAAAIGLLDRELPPGYTEHWTGHFAAAEELEEANTEAAVIFRLGPDWFALSALVVDEITELRRIHSLPHRRSSGVLGLVNVRGSLIICVSLARMLGLGESAAPAAGQTRGRLMVVREETRRMAFAADEVHHTHRYNRRDLKLAPATVVKAGVNFTAGILSWRDRLVSCLDDRLLLQSLNRAVA